MAELFTLLCYQPLFNLLIYIYNILPNHDLGIAIILLTVLVKLILFPFSWQQLEAQKNLQKLQPKLDEIREKFKDDKQKLAEAQMNLFKEEKINPLSSCLPTLFQFPFLIALFYVFMDGLKAQKFNLLYPFVANPGQLNDTFLGFLSLTANHDIPLALLVGISQFIQIKLTMPPQKAKKSDGGNEDFSSILQKQMLIFIPLMTAVMSYQFPNGLGIYWFMQTLLTLAQYWFMEWVKKNPTQKTV